MSVIVFYNYAASMIAQRFIRCIQPTAEPHRKPFSFFRVFYTALIAGLTQNTEAKPISKSSEEEPSFYRISAALFRVLCLVLGIIFSAVSLFFLVCCILIIIEGFGFLSVMLLFFSFLSFTVIGCRYFLLFFWIDVFDKIDNALHNGLPEAVMPSGAPDAEAPSAEAANAEAANAEAPSAEAPDVKAPSAEAADAEAPATEAPQA